MVGNGHDKNLVGFYSVDHVVWKPLYSELAIRGSNRCPEVRVLGNLSQRALYGIGEASPQPPETVFEKPGGSGEISFGSIKEPDVDQDYLRSSRTRANTSSAGRADSSPER